MFQESTAAGALWDLRDSILFFTRFATIHPSLPVTQSLITSPSGKVGLFFYILHDQGHFFSLISFILYHIDQRWKNKFWGKSLEILPTGMVNVILKR